MKHLFCICALLISFLFYGQAYDGIGDKKVQIGISTFGYGTGLSGTYDHGLHPIFSVGGGADIYFDDDDNDDNFYLYGRGNAHVGSLLNLPSNMDLYPGLTLGLVGDDFGIGGHVGYRYFFTDTFGAFIELGSRGSFGVSIDL